jgi:hypothetical protein
MGFLVPFVAMIIAMTPPSVCFFPVSNPSKFFSTHLFSCTICQSVKGAEGSHSVTRQTPEKLFHETRGDMPDCKGAASTPLTPDWKTRYASIATTSSGDSGERSASKKAFCSSAPVAGTSGTKPRCTVQRSRACPGSKPPPSATPFPVATAEL